MNAMSRCRLIKWLAVAGLLAALAPPVAADDLAIWTFEVSYPGLPGSGSNSPLALAEGGVYGPMSVASGWHVNPTTVWSSPVGNGSPHAFSANTWNVEDYWQFTTSSLGYHALTISWHQTRSTTGPGQFRLEGTFDGMTWMPIADYSIPVVSWTSSGSPNPMSMFGPFPVPPPLFDQPQISLRLVSLVGAVAAGTNRIDNIVISGVPLPPPEGACCYPNGVCLSLTLAQCNDTAGSWQGAGTACDPNPCPVMPTTGMQLVDMLATATPFIGPGGLPVENIQIAHCMGCPAPEGYMDCDAEKGLIYWPVMVSYTVAGQPYLLETVFAGFFMMDPDDDSRFFAFDMGYVEHPELGQMVISNSNTNNKTTGPIVLNCTNGGTASGYFDDMTMAEYTSVVRPWLQSAMPAALARLRQLNPGMPVLPPEILSNILARYDLDPATELVFWFGATNEYASSNLAGTDAWEFTPRRLGACCVGSTCVADKTAAECLAMGGIWQGAGTDCFPNPCVPIDYYWDFLTGEWGGNGWNGEWIYYPESPSGPWWNMWWPNEFALDRQKQITVTFDVNFPTGGGFLEVALNWSTPDWTNTDRPPLAAEEQYIERAILGVITTPGTHTMSFIVPYCPRWVSMDIRGDAYIIEGTIDHICLPGPVQGACCVGITCLPNLTQSECESIAGGIWQGPGTDCFPNPCRRIDYYWDFLTGELGGNGWNGEWIYYPESPSGPWWNMWWPNEFALDRQKQITVTFDVNFPTGGGFLEVALNWSTPEWTNTDRPPLAAEEQYIERAILGVITTPGTHTMSFIVPYCPRWVSMDIRGDAYIIEGTIDHICLPPQLGACCQPGGACAMTTQADCLPPGIWHPEWQSCDPNPCPWDLVVCEPQGGPANNPFHPPTYWYDVTPYGFGRCDFHVRVYDPNPANYTNASLPAATWTFVVHEVNPGEWWASWYDPGCVNAIFSTFRFQFDNPNPCVWSDWTTTISGTSDPFDQPIDQSQNHSDQPDGLGYRVHAPRPRDLEPKWHQEPHPPLQGFDAASDYWWQSGGSVSKWEQMPDPTYAGYHAHDWWDNGVRRLVLADDWLCEGGLVTDLHWWGTIEAPGSGLAGFRLSIHDNSMAACMPAEPPAWLRDVPISQITVTSTGLFNAIGQEIFLYEYNLPQSEWFAQVAGQTYWFDVSAISNDPHFPCQWNWQRAAGMPQWLCPPMYKDIPPFPMWAAFGPDINFAFRITSQPGAGVEVNKVVADDFISDGRPIQAVGWVGSYFDERYEPIYLPMPPYVLDGWLISFHHTLPDAVCPPDILTGVGPTVLGVYFAPADAVRIEPYGDYLDCFEHRVYGYEVDLSRCCLICAVPDPRLPDLPPPAQPGAFREVSGFGYWLDIQAVVGAKWIPMMTEQCELLLTGHLPSPQTPDGHFWGWHTSPEARLETACTGRIADRTPYPPDCWEYGDWVKQPWLCPTMPPVPPVNMAFTLLAPPCLAGDVNWDGVVDVNDIGCFVNCLLYGAMPGCVCPCAEMNGDGVVDGLDIQGFVDALLSP